MDRDSVTSLVSDLTSRLSEIAEEFARRAQHVSTVPAPGPAMLPSEDERLVAKARSLLAERRARSRFLPAELFHEPAWDMLLALFVAQHDRRVMNVKTLVGHSDAPATTSQRWIDHLAKLGLIDRVTDTVDRRRIEVQLSDAGDLALRKLLASLG